MAAKETQWVTEPAVTVKTIRATELGRLRAKRLADAGYTGKTVTAK